MLLIKTEILNLQLNSMLVHVRHIITLAIANRRFPLWLMIEEVDLSFGMTWPSREAKTRLERTIFPAMNFYPRIATSQS